MTLLASTGYAAHSAPIGFGDRYSTPPPQNVARESAASDSYRTASEPLRPGNGFTRAFGIGTSDNFTSKVENVQINGKPGDWKALQYFNSNPLPIKTNNEIKAILAKGNAAQLTLTGEDAQAFAKYVYNDNHWPADKKIEVKLFPDQARPAPTTAEGGSKAYESSIGTPLSRLLGIGTSDNFTSKVEKVQINDQPGDWKALQYFNSNPLPIKTNNEIKAILAKGNAAQLTLTGEDAQAFAKYVYNDNHWPAAKKIAVKLFPDQAKAAPTTAQGNYSSRSGGLFSWLGSLFS